MRHIGVWKIRSSQGTIDHPECVSRCVVCGRQNAEKRRVNSGWEESAAVSGWRDWMIGDDTRRAAWEAQTRKLGEIPNATRAVEVSLRCTSHAVLVSVVTLVCPSSKYHIATARYIAAELCRPGTWCTVELFICLSAGLPCLATRLYCLSSLLRSRLS
ncbi:uncharacterized protein CCOS01_09522 [Colletotrichum costaricense]|uniref:Uncharacterized protein n=1 Tax=Colletotrichum costaricense TaxID=1209916 RepID=A0AAI9YUP1_9PEZI|nr:uncharacterized protein CCOS01_09522 [Colletotrichum costaricense]KAK1524435.1 hypothetical protein CCOS01_09522 [Colletotrichum costaricense]